MAMKKMYLANFNLTFGDKEEPLLNWLDEYVVPALTSGIKRVMSDRTKIMFEDVQIQTFHNGELVLTGIIIKDTVLDIYNEYTDKEGLKDKNDHPKSAPYSVFVVYLKNHRMALVKRQPGSPDLRLFSSTIMDVLKEYRKKENKRRKENGNVLLPYAIIGIKSLKSVKDISEALKDVKKINKMTIKMKPSNNEFGEDMSNILGGLDEKIRKRSESKLLKVTVSSPKSIQGVKKIIENTNGLAETELDVEYFCDEGLESERKSIGRISDNQISRAIDVSFPDDLRHAVSDIYRYCSDIEDLQVETPNIVDYRKYIEKKRK